jgi:TonB family protein
MANSPIRVPIPSRESINAALISPHERARAEAFDVDSIFASLRERLSSGTQEIGLFAASIAEAAQFLTEATGAAVGLRYDEGVFCLGRSGETAPPVGAELALKSGFSAECVRSAQSLRCDDARHDYRTDAAACRQLGVFAIAAVPIRGEKGCVGLLEVFSNRTYAFSERHMVFLERLAELASIAQEREVNKPITEQHREAPAGDVPGTVRDLTGRMRGVWELARPRNWALGAGILALVISVIRLEPWRAPHNSAPKARAVQQQPATDEDKILIDAVIPKPTPGHGAVTVAVVKPSTLRKDLADHVTIRRADVSLPPEQRHTAQNADAVPQDILPPATAAAPASNSPPLELSSDSRVLPEGEISASQGVSGGTLLHKVQPSYPKQALVSRLEGSVTLSGTIGETGRLKDLKVIRGDPLLARAALEAVQQWQYEPYTLNGKFITEPTEITINFRLAQ